MPRVTVDGRQLDVPPGTTVLDGAAQLGIDIPTLCRVEGLPPLTSCFVCLVQVVGQRKLAPACATVLEEGMAVVTDSDEVAAGRRASVELLLSDHLGECTAPCEISCPAGFRIPQFMKRWMQGKAGAAARIARDDLVFPELLGRICPRFCENTCRRADRDESLAIAAMHRYTAAREISVDELALPPIAPPSGKRIAIVGAGPTGLTAAYDLLRRGHACTLIDQNEDTGGILRYTLDETRLPKDVLSAEAGVVHRMGAELRMNTRLGRDITLAELREQYDAVLLAIGAPLWQKLDYTGGLFATSAGEMLGRIARGEEVNLEGHVVVVGAGHEAVEMARTAVRHGAVRVSVLCPRPRAHLPLLAGQIAAAEAENVEFEFACQIEAVERPSDDGMFVTATRATGPKYKTHAHHLLAATGRDVELDMLGEQGVMGSRRGIKVDRQTLATNLPGVFAGGDAVSGGGFCVRAVAYGHAVADSIHQHVMGLPATGPARPLNVRYGKLPPEELAMLLKRTANAGERAAELDNDKTAQTEAHRCLMCGCRESDRCQLRQVATQVSADPMRFRGERRPMERDESHELVVYESHKCIVCGACVAVCEQSRDALGLTYIGRGFDVRISAPWEGNLSEAMGELARRCAEVCPTSAIVLKDRADEPKP